jgi:hypothetical protein
MTESHFPTLTVRWLRDDARQAFERLVDVANSYLQHLAERAQSLPLEDRIRLQEEGLRTVASIRHSAADLYAKYTITDMVIMKADVTKSP